MPHRIVGIDIGLNSIKATFAETTFRGFTVVECREVPIPSPEEYASINLDFSALTKEEYDILEQNKAVSLEEDVTRKISSKGNEDIKNKSDGEPVPKPIPAFVYGLAKFIQSPGVYFNESAVSIPSKYVSTRIIELPFSDLKKIDQILPIEIENYVPFDIDDMVMSYQIIESSDKMSKILVSLVKKADMKTFLEHLHIAGLDPVVIEIGANSIANAANLAAPIEENVRSILHINADQSDLTIMKGKSLVAVRSIFAGYSIIERKGSGNNLSSFIKLLKQTLQSFRVEFNLPLDTLFISGHIAEDLDFQVELAQALNIEVSLFTPFAYPFEKTVLNDDKTNAIFAKSLGLALSMTAAVPKKHLNLRVDHFAYKRAGGLFKQEIRKIAAMGGVILLLLIYNVGYAHIKSSSEAEEVRRQILEVFSETFPGENITNPVMQFRQNMEMVFKKHKIVGYLGDGDLPAIEILKIISQAVPNTIIVDITKIDISQDRVSIEGKTANFEMVDKLEAAIKTHKIFKEIKKDSATKTAKGAIKFKFNIRISDKSESGMTALMPKLKGGG